MRNPIAALMIAAAVLVAPARAQAPALLDQASAAFMAGAIQAAERGDWELAERYAGHTRSETALHIVRWMRLRRGEGTFDEYVAFLRDRRDWPGLTLLRTRGEAKVPGETDPDATIDYFAEQEPRSGLGSVRLAEAYAAKGRDADAVKTAVRAWREMSLTGGEAQVLLARFGDRLAPHHEARADMLLWRGLTSQAEAMVGRVSDGYGALITARIALRRNQAGVDARIAAVPAELADDPGLAFERFLWRAKRGRDQDAEDLLMERSTSAAALGQPDAWANRRRSLAREEMREGDPERAYAIAANHHLSPGGSDYADLEWLSGYIALRKLGDAVRAREHFAHFRDYVETPISLGRAGFWLGLAEETLGNQAAAREAYGFGAQHQTSFYGQMAAERISAATDPDMARVPDKGIWNDAAFRQTGLLRAALLLLVAEQEQLTKRFFLQLAETLDPGDLERLAALALDLDRPHTALMIAKEAAKAGVVLPAAYFPLVDLAGLDLAVDPELTLAIIRRESEFNPGALSPAGAMGFMQLMPRTAEQTASGLDLEYSRTRLTQDWRYNATLGSAYLAQVLDEFGGSYIMAFAAYNAGPSRVRAWIEQFGDPRLGEIDPVDWIKHIPFRETRNYVMRVMEAVVVYRIRLAGQAKPIRISADLRRR